MMSKIDHNLIHAKNLLHEYEGWISRVESLEKARSEESYIQQHRDEKDKLFNEIVRLVKIGLEND